MKLSWVGKIGLGLIGLAIVLGLGAYFLGLFPSHESEARAQLKAALNGWAAQTSAAKFQETHPTIAFSDTNFHDSRLVRYDIAAPTTTDDSYLVFSAKLTILKDGKEMEIPRTYKVGRGKTPQGKEVWAIVGHTK
jgi:hypothetical protein